MGWDLDPSDGSLGSDVTPMMAYVYGVIVVLATVITLGEWVGQRHRRHRTRDDRRSAYRSYFAMAILWPLFITTVLFIVLWSVLGRRDR